MFGTTRRSALVVVGLLVISHVVVQILREFVFGHIDGMGGLADTRAPRLDVAYVFAFLLIGLALRSRFFWALTATFFALQAALSAVGIVRLVFMDTHGLSLIDWVLLAALALVDGAATCVLIRWRHVLVPVKVKT